MLISQSSSSRVAKLVFPDSSFCSSSTPEGEADERSTEMSPFGSLRPRLFVCGLRVRRLETQNCDSTGSDAPRCTGLLAYNRATSLCGVLASKQT